MRRWQTAAATWILYVLFVPCAASLFYAAEGDSPGPTPGPANFDQARLKGEVYACQE